MNMDLATHSSIVGFIWNIADDVLRDLYGVIRCRFVFSGKNDELTPDFF